MAFPRRRSARIVYDMRRLERRDRMFGMPDMPMQHAPTTGGEGIAVRDDSRDDPLRWKRRADSRLAVTAVHGHINEHKRRVQNGMIGALLDTQAAVKCLDVAVEVALRDATHDDPRTRIQAAKLAIKVVQLAELLTRESQAQSRGDTHDVLAVGGQPIPADDRCRAGLRRLRELTGR